MSELAWYTTFSASEKPSEPGTVTKPGDPTKLILEGVLINTTENKNNWSVEEEDFQMLADDFIGKQIRTDHAEKVANVLGIVTGTDIDQPHTEAKADWDPATEFTHIHFKAEIASSDLNITTPIKMKYVTGVSPAVDARTLLCANCKEPMYDKNIKRCKCREGGVLLKDLAARELSIVCSPAYQGTNMSVMGFAAAVDRSFLSEERLLEIVEDEIAKRNL